MITAFTNARIFTGEEELNDISLLIENGVILDFKKAKEAEEKYNQ